MKIKVMPPFCMLSKLVSPQPTERSFQRRKITWPHLWPNPVFPLGALRHHNVYLCSQWTQMLKKARGIIKSSQTRSHTAPVIEKIHYYDELSWRILCMCLFFQRQTKDKHTFHLFSPFSFIVNEQFCQLFYR